MALNQQQVSIVMSQSVEQIKKYIADGLLKFPDDLLAHKDSPKFKAIEKELSNIPAPEALARWKEISGIPAADISQLSRALSEFITKYGQYPGNASMIDRARQKLGAITSEVEKADWEAVTANPTISGLLTHRHKYQATTHEADIDNRVWELTDPANNAQVNRYLQEFPNGLHRSEAQEVKSSQELWIGVSTDADLITLSDYIQEMPLSPFIPKARELMTKLKVDEIRDMIENPGTYSPEMLKMLIDEGIFSQDELIANGVCSESTFDMLANPPELPNIEQKENPNPTIVKGPTDVFLFGIPSSGKTCVLMGLLGSRNFIYDNAAEGLGGEYADNLSIYRRHGKAPGRTYGNFVAQIQGAIYPDNSPVTYPINLIEMSGEEFAMKIALNPENKVDFEDMGTGATQLLTSDNRKIIFIVIDPTATGLIKITSEREDGSSVTKIVEQDIIITKMVNMLIKNPKVLKNTNAIHFIMTKSDILGSRSERDQVAVDRIRSLYGKTITTLRDICKNYSINKSTDYQPSLFTFSLGQFHVGDLFEYDSYDADKLMKLITSMAQGRKESGFFSKFQNKVN